MGIDRSERRLRENRCLPLLDDASNWFANDPTPPKSIMADLRGPDTSARRRHLRVPADQVLEARLGADACGAGPTLAKESGPASTWGGSDTGQEAGPAST